MGFEEESALTGMWFGDESVCMVRGGWVGSGELVRFGKWVREMVFSQLLSGLLT